MLIGLVLVVLELLPVGGLLFWRRESKQDVVGDDALGRVTLERSMVRAVVRHVAEEVPGLVHVDPDVRDGADRFQRAACASLAWDADAPAFGQLLQERIKESVRTQLGLAVAAVRVTAQATSVVKDQRRRVARVA